MKLKGGNFGPSSSKLSIQAHNWTALKGQPTAVGGHPMPTPQKNPPYGGFITPSAGEKPPTPVWCSPST